MTKSFSNLTISSFSTHFELVWIDLLKRFLLLFFQQYKIQHSKFIGTWWAIPIIMTQFLNIRSQYNSIFGLYRYEKKLYSIWGEWRHSHWINLGTADAFDVTAPVHRENQHLLSAGFLCVSCPLRTEEKKHIIQYGIFCQTHICAACSRHLSQC